jgi:hypothetical protein
MKRLILALSLVVLSGCAVIFPKPHDPYMLSDLAEVKLLVGSIKCGSESMWGPADMRIEKLQIYTTWKDDPQAPAVKSLRESLIKARESKNVTFCESLLKINKTRIDVIADAWKGRK